MVEETCLPYPTLGMVCTPGKGEEAGTEKQGDQDLKVRLDYRDSVKRKKKTRGLRICLGLIPKTIKLGVATEESQI